MLLTNYKASIATTLPGGERHLVPDWLKAARVMGYTAEEHIKFNWRIASSNDLMDLLLVYDALSRICRLSCKNTTLGLYYFPYARADRPDAGNGALGAKVMAGLINSLNFTTVIILEPHSEVAPALINNVMVNSYDYASVVRSYKGEGRRVYVVAPDLGGIKRAQKAASKAGVQMVRFDKKREPGTGKILETTCLDNLSMIVEEGITPYFVIVDDIVDGGGTFTPIALYLKNYYPSAKVILNTPHAILSKSASGVIAINGHGLMGIDELVCTNSIRDLVGPNITQENLYLY